MNEKDVYLHIKVDGSITQQDIERAQEYFGESLLQKGVIIDFTNADVRLTTIHEIQQLVNVTKPISNKRRGLKAALVGYFDEELLFLKTIKAVAEHNNFKTDIKVFTYLCEADEWLNS